MPEATIVGAGLSGLVAAINLARKGFEVTVYEREKRIGGIPEFRPDPAGSPFDLEAIKNYTGIDISPVVKSLDESSVWAYGKRFTMPLKSKIGMYMVERGSRKSSIDSYLYSIAKEEGVKVVFDHPILTQKDFAMLPPDTIIATGLQIETYQALNIPHSPLFGYFAKGTVSHDRTIATLWMDTFTKDYAFNCTTNGVSFALLFQRDAPLKKEGKEKFKAMLSQGEGIEFSEWKDLLGGACPVGSIRNPHLFWGNKILAGTLAGVIDPFLFFGMLGALISGKIASIAVEDRGTAWEHFKKAVWTFYPTYMSKKIWNLTPHVLRKSSVRFSLNVLPRVENIAVRRFAFNIPGWKVPYISKTHW